MKDLFIQLTAITVWLELVCLQAIAAVAFIAFLKLRTLALLMLFGGSVVLLTLRYSGNVSDAHRTSIATSAGYCFNAVAVLLICMGYGKRS